MKRLKKQKAFTIAEITISFILIAGIAMILMPVIFSNTQSQVLMTALNKNYTAMQDIHQAIPMLQARGKIPPGEIDATKFMSAVALTQKCIGLDSKGKILTKNKYSHYINGYATKTVPANLVGYTQFSLDDSDTLAKTTIILKNNIYISKYSYRGTDYIMIDINGKKMPNETGKDIFFFEIVNIDVGSDSTNSVFRPVFNNNCTPGGVFASSQGCAAKYLEAGSME